MKALVNVVGFGPFICLFLEGAASGILVQALVERLWDITHTFHIVEREIIVTHDFHQMTSLRSYGSSINLEGEFGIQLAIDLLGRAYPSECIRHFYMERDYKPHSSATPDDHAQMAKAFMIYVVGAYLFANGGQLVSLRWLALFRDFDQAREANWGHACLAYLYSVMDTSSWGTLR